MRATALAILVAACLAGCVVADGDVLVLGPTLHGCQEAVTRVSDHQACDFTDVCALPLPMSPTCCAELVACTGGSLSVRPYCDDGCVTCDGDSDCEPGMRLCDGQQCVACPDVTSCATCPAGTAPITRNGCRTCECAPPSQCEASDPAGHCDPMNTQVCYPGQRCGDGCQPGEAGCCLNVCALPGCASPAPLGCDTPCRSANGCMTCQTTNCRCDGMAWTCDEVCADLTGACFFPR